MPDLAQHLQVGAAGPSEDLATWSRLLSGSLSRAWTQMVQVLNALSRTDTLANRPATPDLNHSFFTTSDSKQTFIGVAGVWEAVGPRRGSVTIANPATTGAVTLTPNEPNTNYRLSFLADYNSGATFYTAKAAGGFTVNVTTSPGASGVVDWLLQRD